MVYPRNYPYSQKDYIPIVNCAMTRALIPF